MCITTTPFSFPLQVHIWAFTRERLTIEKEGVVTFSDVVLKIFPHPSLKAIGVMLRGNTVLLRHLGNKEVDELNIRIQDSNVTVLTQTHQQVIYGTDRGKIYVWNYEVSVVALTTK